MDGQYSFKDCLIHNWWFFIMGLASALRQSGKESVFGFTVLDVLLGEGIVLAILYVYWFIRYGKKQNQVKWLHVISMEKKITIGIIGILIIVGIFFSFNETTVRNGVDTTFTKATENSEIDIFAQRYADFRNQQYETSVDSYVPITDFSSETGEKNYFVYLAGAVDTKQVNTFRKNNAEQALLSYDSFNQKAMDAFSDKIIKLDSATSQLIEAASKINNDEYRFTAIEIAKDARKIQQGYGSLWKKYVDRFDLQTRLLNNLIENGGDIFSLGTTLKVGGPKIQKISEDIASLTSEIDKMSHEMDDLYFSLKGRAGIENYPNQFTEN